MFWGILDFEKRDSTNITFRSSVSDFWFVASKYKTEPQHLKAYREWCLQMLFEGGNKKLNILNNFVGPRCGVPMVFLLGFLGKMCVASQGVAMFTNYQWLQTWNMFLSLIMRVLFLTIEKCFSTTWTFPNNLKSSIFIISTINGNCRQCLRPISIQPPGLSLFVQDFRRSPNITFLDMLQRSVFTRWIFKREAW